MAVVAVEVVTIGQILDIFESKSILFAAGSDIEWEMQRNQE